MNATSTFTGWIFDRCKCLGILRKQTIRRASGRVQTREAAHASETRGYEMIDNFIILIALKIMDICDRYTYSQAVQMLRKYRRQLTREQFSYYALCIRQKAI